MVAEGVSTMWVKTLILAVALLAVCAPHGWAITIDGDFNDWEFLPSYPDPPGDPDNRDDRYNPILGLNNPPVDCLEWKFTHDNDNVYAYCRVVGTIGQGQFDDRYYWMLHMDVDNNLSTGFETYIPFPTPAEEPYTDWYYPGNIGCDYTFEFEFLGGVFSRTFITYWGPGGGVLGRWKYRDMVEMRDNVPVMAWNGSEVEISAPIWCFDGNVHIGTIMDLSVSIESSGKLQGTGWCQDSSETLENYVFSANEPPETIVTGGPCGLVISTDAATICWEGSDDQTPPSALLYSRRLDAGAWTPFSDATCADLTDLSEGAHVFEVKAQDQAGSEDSTAARCEFTVDLSAPSVSVTSPAHGATVKGTVNISASASHPSGIQKVEFYAGGQLISTDASAPYSYSWNTKPVSVAEGPTQLCAKAYSNDAKVAWACVLVSVDNTTFDDVSKTSSQWSYVEALVAAGITSGCSTNPRLYCPYSSITRAQMAVFIIRAMGETPYNKPTPTFTDVPAGHWAYGYIERMYALGITGGCATSPLRYCPDASVNRSQMAVFLCRATGNTWLNPGAPTFADVPESASFYGYVERLADPASWGGTAVTSGCALSPRRYCPYSPVTRGQMAVFLCRAFGIPL